MVRVGDQSWPSCVLTVPALLFPMTLQLGQIGLLIIERPLDYYPAFRERERERVNE